MCADIRDGRVHTLGTFKQHRYGLYVAASYVLQELGNFPRLDVTHIAVDLESLPGTVVVRCDAEQDCHRVEIVFSWNVRGRRMSGPRRVTAKWSGKRIHAATFLYRCVWGEDVEVVVSGD